MKLEPYLCFYGKTEEALNFYAKALGGTFEINRYEGSPAAEGAPPEFLQKVLHSTFTGDGFSFMASDGRPGSVPNGSQSTEISLCLSMSDASAGRRAFDALAEGGTVTMPYEDAFWGGTFGVVDDRYGVSWMVMGGRG